MQEELIKQPKTDEKGMSLDLSRLKSSPVTLKDYHKLRLPIWPPNEVIDQSFTCISCGLQSSPRSTTPIIPKIKFIDRNTGLPVTPRTAKRYVEYCCNDCVGGIKSTASSPRTSTIEFAPPTPPSPRGNQEKAQRDRVERRRSIDHRGANLLINHEMEDLGSLIPIPVSLRSSNGATNPDFIRRSSNDGNNSPINSSPARRSSNLSRSKTASDLNVFNK
jgi:hypothetical protein